MQDIGRVRNLIFLFVLISVFLFPVVYADTYLDETNVLGSPGNEHWDILYPGTYILTYSSPVIDTNNNYAIRIFTSDVIFDGNGKTITGPGIGTSESGPSYYGVRVNSGTLTRNVTVKNLNVLNKNLGIIYEYVQGGAITSSSVISNKNGITTWKCSHLNILSNTANSNTHAIVLDANAAVNEYITIDSNNIFSNSQFGILLWLSNNHNVISNNQVNYNNMGISMTDGGSLEGGMNNTISTNTIIGNVNGLFVSDYHSNRIIDNSLSGNTNDGVWISGGSSGNLFINNYVQNSGWVGTYLSGSSNGNVFYNNVFKNIDNEESDGSVSNNLWYTTPISGVNIIGGPSIGGNYWSNPSSTGFSEKCLDSNFNGFCDQSYNPQSDLIDRYPLHPISSTNDAQVTGNTIPSAMVGGQSYPVTLTMMNTGTMTWNEASMIRLGNANADAYTFKLPDVGGYRVSLPAGTSVAPGESYTFSWTVTAPTTVGTYTPTYQMVWDGHQWFGQKASQTLVVTVPAVNALVVSISIPSTMVGGQSYPVTVTMKNIGTMTWNEASMIRLGNANADAYTFKLPDVGGYRVSLPAGTSVPPGESYTFSWTVTAPTTVGTYTPTYQMVWDGHQWFGAQASQTVVVLR
jgi:parallel beta-helix repeat protein